MSVFAEGLKDLLDTTKEKTTGEATDLLYGVVTQVNPLIVRVENKFDIDENFIITTRLTRKLEFTIPAWQTDSGGGFSHTHELSGEQTISHDLKIEKDGVEDPDLKLVGDVKLEGKQEITSHNQPPHPHTVPPHTVTVWDGLQVGDRIMLLRVHQGQLYIALDKA